MIEPLPPERDDEDHAWRGICVFFAAFLWMLAIGVIRAMIAGRL